MKRHSSVKALGCFHLAEYVDAATLSANILPTFCLVAVAIALPATIYDVVYIDSRRGILVRVMR